MDKICPINKTRLILIKLKHILSKQHFKDTKFLEMSGDRLFTNPFLLTDGQPKNSDFAVAHIILYRSKSSLSVAVYI